MKRLQFTPDSSVGAPAAPPAAPGVSPPRPVAPAPAPAHVPAGPVPTVKPPNHADVPVSKIRAFEQGLSGAAKSGTDTWKRKPNSNGTGATHVKSFHCKLTGESLEFMDKQINDWLEAHPELEVKLVTSTVGEWLGKLKEPNLIIQVWV